MHGETVKQLMHIIYFIMLTCFDLFRLSSGH